MPGRPASRHAFRALLGAVLVGGMVFAPAASADLVGHDNATIANTTASLQDNLAGPAGCQSGPAAPTCAQILATPGTSGVDAPQADRAGALQRLGTTSAPLVAAEPVPWPRAVLAGAPLPRRPSSGMGLLNWHPFDKVRTVGPGDTVTVNVVRTPQRTLSDTWLLDFTDPTQPYTIRYRISDAGGARIGQLRPTPLLADAGGPIGGPSSPRLPPSTPSPPTGTTLVSRFTGPAGGVEASRSAVQEVTVRMPPADVTQAILEPGTGAGGSAP